jgi:hypothetical protein
MLWNGTQENEIETPTGHSASEILVWVAENGGRAYCQKYDKTYFYVITPLGEMNVHPGWVVVMRGRNDFIVMSAQEFYDAFEPLEWVS